MSEGPHISAPSIALSLPGSITVRMVLDDLVELGRVWREIDHERTSEQDVVRQIFSEQFEGSLQIVAFNLTEGWRRDVKTSPERWRTSPVEMAICLGPRRTRFMSMQPARTCPAMWRVWIRL